MIVNNNSNSIVQNYDVKKMGKEDFLKLFVAQLQYQDPLEPLKNEEFTSHLAQFSSLEELGNIKDEISKLSTKYDKQIFLYSDLIGKTVKTSGSNPVEGKVTAINIGEDITITLDNSKQCILQDIVEIK